MPSRVSTQSASGSVARNATIAQPRAAGRPRTARQIPSATSAAAATCKAISSGRASSASRLARYARSRPRQLPCRNQWPPSCHASSAVNGRRNPCPVRRPPLDHLTASMARKPDATSTLAAIRPRRAGGGDAQATSVNGSRTTTA
ncbi:hypothetical protein D3C83_27230 [compost metagenome]